MTNSDAFATLLEPAALSLIAGLTALIMLITYATNNITLKRVIGGSLRAIGAGVFIMLVEVQVHTSAGTAIGIIDVIGIIAGVGAVTLGYWLAYTIHLIEGARKGWHLRLVARAASNIAVRASAAELQHMSTVRKKVLTDTELHDRLARYVEHGDKVAIKFASSNTPARKGEREDTDGTVRLD